MHEHDALVNAAVVAGSLRQGHLVGNVALGRARKQSRLYVVLRLSHRDEAVKLAPRRMVTLLDRDALAEYALGPLLHRNFDNLLLSRGNVRVRTSASDSSLRRHELAPRTIQRLVADDTLRTGEYGFILSLVSISFLLQHLSACVLAVLYHGVDVAAVDRLWHLNRAILRLLSLVERGEAEERDLVVAHGLLGVHLLTL